MDPSAELGPAGKIDGTANNSCKEVSLPVFSSSGYTRIADSIELDSVLAGAGIQVQRSVARYANREEQLHNESTATGYNSKASGTGESISNNWGKANLFSEQKPGKTATSCLSCLRGTNPRLYAIGRSGKSPAFGS